MISPTTDCYWLVRTEGSAAEFIASTLSVAAMNDITEAVLVSADFDTDIQANISLDFVVSALQEHLEGEAIVYESFNPLYIPSSIEAIDDVMEGISEDTMKFTGMDGSPYTMKTLGVTQHDREIISAKVTYKPFDLPSYNDIIKEQSELRLN